MLAFVWKSLNEEFKNCDYLGNECKERRKPDSNASAYSINNNLQKRISNMNTDLINSVYVSYKQ